MKYLWDTHALIWGMEDDPKLSDKARELATEGQNAVADISLWEVSALLEKGRIRLRVPLEEWFDELGSRLAILPITPAVAIRAYELGDFHGDPADRIIAATSLVFDLPLITRDEKLRKHPKLCCIWD